MPLKLLQKGQSKQVTATAGNLDGNKISDKIAKAASVTTCDYPSKLVVLAQIDKTLN